MVALDEPLYQLRILVGSVSMTNLFTQAQYATFIQLLARQRHEQGRDDLDVLTDTQIASLRNSLLPDTPVNQRRVIAQRYYYFADLIYFVGRYKTAITWILAALRAHPTHYKYWILLYKIIVCRILPERLAQHLRHDVLPSTIPKQGTPS